MWPDLRSEVRIYSVLQYPYWREHLIMNTGNFHDGGRGGVLPSYWMLEHFSCRESWSGEASASILVPHGISSFTNNRNSTDAINVRAFREAELIQRQRIHTGEKPHVRNGCENALRSSELIRHLGSQRREVLCEHNGWGRAFNPSSVLRRRQLA